MGKYMTLGFRLNLMPLTIAIINLEKNDKQYYLFRWSICSLTSNHICMIRRFIYHADSTSKCITDHAAWADK